MSSPIGERPPALLRCRRAPGALHLVVEAGPHAGQAVRLQLHAHLQRVGAHARRRCAPSWPAPCRRCRAASARDGRPRARSRRPARNRPGAWKRRFSCSIEGEVDVDLLVERAIERAHRRLASAACRSAWRRVNSTSFGFSIVAARRLEDAAPTRPRCRPARGARSASSHPWPAPAPVLAPRAARNVALTADLGVACPGSRCRRPLSSVERIDAEHQADGADDQQRRDAHAAAADRDRNAALPPPGNMPPRSPRRSSTAFAFTDLVVVAHGLILDRWCRGQAPFHLPATGRRADLDPEDTLGRPRSRKPAAHMTNTARRGRIRHPRSAPLPARAQHAGWPGACWPIRTGCGPASTRLATWREAATAPSFS